MLAAEEKCSPSPSGSYCVFTSFVFSELRPGLHVLNSSKPMCACSCLSFGWLQPQNRRSPFFSGFVCEAKKKKGLLYFLRLMFVLEKLWQGCNPIVAHPSWCEACAFCWFGSLRCLKKDFFSGGNSFSRLLKEPFSIHNFQI